MTRDKLVELLWERFGPEDEIMIWDKPIQEESGYPREINLLIPVELTSKDIIGNEDCDTISVGTKIGVIGFGC